VLNQQERTDPFDCPDPGEQRNPAARSSGDHLSKYHRKEINVNELSSVTLGEFNLQEHTTNHADHAKSYSSFVFKGLLVGKQMH